MFKYKLTLLVMATILFTSALNSRATQAAYSPLALPLVQRIELPPEDFSIVGARISLLWGEHRSVSGLDIGLIGNRTEQTFVGSAISGIFNETQGSATVVGLQFAGIANVNGGKSYVYGLQVAAGVNTNAGEGLGGGMQLALLTNQSPHMVFTGVQISGYNVIHEVYGMQIGLVNVADILHGVQIGLLNYNRQGLFAFAPFINIGF